MLLKNPQKLLLVALATASLQLAGCATHDYRDAAWDPRPGSGQRLHDVLPNWDKAAPCRPWTQPNGQVFRVCGGRVMGLWSGR